MALQIKDRVKETAAAPGSGQITLGGAVTGFQAFSAACANGDVIYYGISDGGANWEVGLGTFVSSGGKLTRTTVLASSNSGSAVNFTNAITVWGDVPASVTPLTYFASAVASASASISFNNFPSWVNNLEIDISNLVSTDNGAVFDMQYSEDNGSTYKTSGYQYGYVETLTSAGGATSGHNASAAQIVLASSVSSAGINALTGQINVKIRNINASGVYKSCIFQSAYAQGSEFACNSGGGTYGGDTGGINAVRFKFSSNNIASGNFSLKGTA